MCLYTKIAQIYCILSGIVLYCAQTEREQCAVFPAGLASPFSSLQGIAKKEEPCRFFQSVRLLPQFRKTKTDFFRLLV